MNATDLLLAVPAAYKSAVIALMIAEANVIVDKLNLPEDTPITAEKLTMAFVCSPAVNRQDGTLGTIETRRFGYSFGTDNKLTTLGRRDLLNPARLSDEELTKQYRRLAIAASQVDTNAAWRAMLPYVSAGLLDAGRLERECKLELRHKRWGELHVPIYTAVWTRNDTEIARISILMPGGVLRAFLINDPSYSLRPSIKVPKTKEAAIEPIEGQPVPGSSNDGLGSR